MQRKKPISVAAGKKSAIYIFHPCALHFLPPRSIY